MARRKLSLDPSIVGELTVAELELLEERTGRPLSTLFDPGAERGKLLHALAYVVLTREAEDAGRVVVQLGGDEEVAAAVDPTDDDGRSLA
jgi:hypothetical protein